jgi:hypothetical protein
VADDDERARLNELVVQIQRRQLACAPGERLARLKEDLRELAPDNLRVALETLVLGGVDAMSADEGWSQQKDRRSMAIAGGGGLIVFVVIALMVPNPTAFQYFVFRVVIALAGGGVAAFLPGEFGIKATGNGLVVRATSAVGVFVFLYWLNPPSLVSPGP